ncbi:MAG: UvrD-helicase domain-containing protein, partial [Clostridia bacterium]|nr:UvrD-helicase domain-containing protein [Clostridia bacterium]
MKAASSRLARCRTSRTAEPSSPSNNSDGFFRMTKVRYTMAREWTAAQRTAIDTRDRTLLLSAAAGSGKTAVLTERIISSLLDPENPADISRMLIVT